MPWLSRVCGMLLLAIALAAPVLATPPVAPPADATTAAARIETAGDADDASGAADDGTEPPAAAPAPGLAVLGEVVVSGQLPGPGLWKVSRDGHVMYVLGTVSPLPKRMQWNSLDVERRVLGSGTVLMPPSVSLKPRGAMLGGVFLVPSLMSARNNPDGRKLQDVLPAADYARWLRLKATYLGRDRGVEKRRPFIAGSDLREEALSDHDLSRRDVVGRVVRAAAKEGDVPVVSPSHVIEIEDPRGAIKEFKRSELDDIDCFRRMLDQVENDLGTLAARANAWALGDLAALEALPYTDAASACTETVMRSSLAQSRGLAALPDLRKREWVAAAEKAIAGHAQSFAVLPMALVTGPSGYLAALREKGYVVEAPVAVANPAPADDASAPGDEAAPSDAPPAAGGEGSADAERPGGAGR